MSYPLELLVKISYVQHSSKYQPLENIMTTNSSYHQPLGIKVCNLNYFKDFDGTYTNFPDLEVAKLMDDHLKVFNSVFVFRSYIHLPESISLCKTEFDNKHTTATRQIEGICR